MSDPGGVTPETKHRVTRSSIGQTASTGADLGKSEDGNPSERALSPSNSRSSFRSRASTPTHDTPTVTPDQSFADGTAPAPSPAARVKSKMGNMIIAPISQTTRRSLRSANKLNTDEESDQYCWICRKDGIVNLCQLCPRVYHLKCLGLSSSPSDDWICVECEKVMRSECEDTRPKALSNLSMEQLIACLQYALERMKVPNSEVFQVPVDTAMVPGYYAIIAHPMDMSQLDKNIKKKMYGSTEAFLADAKWILHNSIVYNGVHNKYTMTAKSILKVCRGQMAEIETCPDCFLSSCTQESYWFCRPCRFIHPLVWAKLKGYPFWPAKALREVEGQVDCRFFGAHDKAWVPAHQIFMLSSESPAPIKNKKGSGFDEAMAELDRYITKFKARYGSFNYAPLKEPYRADYGQTTTIITYESRKRRMLSGEESDSPLSKKLDTGAVSILRNRQDGMESSNDIKPAVEEKPPVKIEPEKPGVFTISDEMLAGATDTQFSILKDEEVRETPADSVVNRIEEKLKLAMDAETKHSSLEGSKLPSGNLFNGELKPNSNDGAPIINTNGSKPLCDKTPTPVDTLSSGAPLTESTSEAPTTASAPAEGTPSSANDAFTHSEATPVKDTPTAVEDTSTPMEDTPTPVLVPPTDEEYTQKLEKTINSCKSQLGMEDSQVVNEEADSGDTDSESDSESDYDYFHHSRKQRRRSGRTSSTRKIRIDVRDAMTVKERGVTDKLFELMRNGLESTIKDIVKQTLLGEQPTTQGAPADKEAPASKEASASDNQTATSNEQNISDSKSLLPTNCQTVQSVDNTMDNPEPRIKQELSPDKLDIVAKNGPLGESTNLENSHDSSNADMPISTELVEKLTWKHKCEIEAVKHNAELAAMEMRKSIELEKERALWRLRKQLEHKFKKIIEETKKKQWCAMCGKEAIFYCCWNTSYCDYPCQQKHWPSHLKTCAQISKDETSEKKSQSAQSTSHGQNNPIPERTPQAAHSNQAPPPYMPTSASSELTTAPQYQLMPQGQVQYMSTQLPPNTGHVYQAQLPVQAMPMQSSARNQMSPAAGAPLLYPVMNPPSTQGGPPQPQSYMLSQRQPYRLAPKYS